MFEDIQTSVATIFILLGLIVFISVPIFVIIPYNMDRASDRLIETLDAEIIEEI
jgi:hypothetical protein